MTKRLPKSSKSVAVLPTDYAPLLAEIKARIRTAQVKAALAANAELVLLYWQMGQRIAEMQAKEGWGAGVIPRLAADLHAEFPEMRGFSERNIGYMIRFALEYGEPPPCSSPLHNWASPENPKPAIVQAPLAQTDLASEEPALRAAEMRRLIAPAEGPERRMSKPSRSLVRPKSALPSDYTTWFSDLKSRIRAAQVKAALSANRGVDCASTGTWDTPFCGHSKNRDGVRESSRGWPLICGWNFPGCLGSRGPICFSCVRLPRRGPRRQ